MLLLLINKNWFWIFPPLHMYAALYLIFTFERCVVVVVVVEGGLLMFSSFHIFMVQRGLCMLLKLTRAILLNPCYI